MVKVIPPRLVQPYLTGQRLVIAGYVYRASDCSFDAPSDYHKSLGLGYEGSEFAADAPELFGPVPRPVARSARFQSSSRCLCPSPSGRRWAGLRSAPRSSSAGMTGKCGCVR